MSWKPEIDELERRRVLASKMGGEERITRQHERGKLTARERVALLADTDSFREFAGLSGRTEYEDGARSVKLGKH